MIDRSGAEAQGRRQGDPTLGPQAGAGQRPPALDVEHNPVLRWRWRETPSAAVAQWIEHQSSELGCRRFESGQRRLLLPAMFLSCAVAPYRHRPHKDCIAGYLDARD
jgi:hypothetical protein